MTHDLNDKTQVHDQFYDEKKNYSANDWSVIGISRRVYSMERRVVHTYGKLKGFDND